MEPQRLIRVRRTIVYEGPEPFIERILRMRAIKNSHEGTKPDWLLKNEERIWEESIIFEPPHYPGEGIPDDAH